MRALKTCFLYTLVLVSLDCRSVVERFDPKRRIDRIKMEAEQGSVEAQLDLGQRYMFGRGLPRDGKLADQWLRRAAGAGNVEAQYLVGWLYMPLKPADVKIVESDPAESIRWLRTAAESGHPSAQLHLAKHLRVTLVLGVSQGKHEEFRREALIWLRKAAHQGVAKAMCLLGDAYRDGEAVIQDSSIAFDWFTRAAESGDLDGQYALGEAYEIGSGTKTDVVNAFRWFQKAADAGHASAQFKVADMFERGEGVRRNDGASRAWMLKAAERGSPDAQYRIGRMYLSAGTAEAPTEGYKWLCRASDGGSVEATHQAAALGYAKAQHRLGEVFLNKNQYEAAVFWLAKAADQGHLVAQIRLAQAYSEGSFVARDHSVALKWLLKAAKQGDVDSQLNLARKYELGDGIGANSAQAFLWYSQAAKKRENEGSSERLGRLQGTTNLGRLYAMGRPGLGPDYPSAARMFQIAADRGLLEAQFRLGLMVLEGKGVPQDLALAYRWLNLAARTGVPSYVRKRDAAARRLTASQLAEAQRMASEWRPLTD